MPVEYVVRFVCNKCRSEISLPMPGDEEEAATVFPQAQGWRKLYAYASNGCSTSPTMSGVYCPECAETIFCFLDNAGLREEG